MNVEEVLQEYNVLYKKAGESPHVRDGWIGVICPWCGEGTNKFGLGIHLQGGACHCWKCGNHSLYEVLRAVCNVSYPDLKQLYSDLSFRRREVSKKQGRLLLPNGIGELQPAHKKYLLSRKFDPEEIQEFWKIQGISHSTGYSWRIFIPIHSNQNIVSWTTRTISDEVEPRYKNAPSSHEVTSRRELLYRSPLDVQRNVCVVVEGPTDAWRIGPGAVATLGLAYSEGQVREIARYPVRVICFDNERVAQQRASKLASDLSVFGGETYKITLSGKDPASSPRGEIWQLRKMFSL